MTPDTPIPLAEACRIGTLYLALAILGALAAIAWRSHHPIRHACVHPTAMPATWFGECK